MATCLGVRQYVIQRLVGHSDRSITDHYDGLVEGELRAAIERVSEYVERHVLGVSATEEQAFCTADQEQV